jgi:hypothetical protein
VDDSESLDAGTVYAIEPADEGQNVEQATDTMSLAALKQARDCMPVAKHLGTPKPDYKRGSRQPYVECRLRKVAIADPLMVQPMIGAVRLDHERSEIADVAFTPMPPPVIVQADVRRSGSVGELTRERRLAASRTAQNDDSMHHALWAKALPVSPLLIPISLRRGPQAQTARNFSPSTVV